MTAHRTEWESRANEKGSSLTGVLFRGFSERVNSILHDWHVWCVHSMLLPRLRASARLLDLGCGYGRIAKTIVAARPDIDIVGQDFVESYCRSFLHAVASSVLADIQDPPFKAGSFDAVLAVTSLMYIKRNDQREAMHRIAGLLKPGGFLLAIDAGWELKKLVAFVLGARMVSPTSGGAFARGEYVSLFEEAGLRVVSRGGNPRTSLPLLVPGLGRSTSTALMNFVAAMSRGDRHARGYSRFALHRWILAQREP